MSFKQSMIVAGFLVVAVSSQSIVSIGESGEYLDTIPQGFHGASSITNCGGPGGPNFVPAVAKSSLPNASPLPTHKWWSSLVWRRCLDDPNASGSNAMYAHPLAFRAAVNGMQIAYAPETAIFPSTDAFTFIRAYKTFLDPVDLVVGMEGLNAQQSMLEDFSDVHIAANWNDGVNQMSITVGRGLPCVYVQNNGASRAKLVFQGQVDLWFTDSNVLGISVATYRGPSVYHHYAIFFAASCTWSRVDGVGPTGAPTTTFYGDLKGTNYLSIVVLPSPSVEILNIYRPFAYAMVTGGSVSWKYQPDTSSVLTTFSYSLSSLDGNPVSSTVIALLPHHLKYLKNRDALVPGIQYHTSHGSMQVIIGPSFSIELPFYGVLPGLPKLFTDADMVQRIWRDLDILSSQDYSFYLPLKADSYWTGKALGKTAQLVVLAHQLGHFSARDAFLQGLKKTLEDWFSVRDGNAFFYYDKTWTSLIGYPPGYGSDTDLNDHHFHYGYFIYAASIIAMFDGSKEWVMKYAPMVDLLIRDTANIDPTDNRFPMNRQFDYFVGHHYASGHAAFGSGNNQESSSEAMNFNGALILWGSVMNRDEIRDLGIMMHALETAAIQHYWFDYDKNVFPNDFISPYSSLVWDDGGSYAIFWGPPHPEEIHGINMLPVTSASFYLGSHPEKMIEYYNYMIEMKGGQAESMWQDVIWTWQSMYSASDAMSKLLKTYDTYSVEPGTTRAHTSYFIANMLVSGPFDASIRANSPHALSFSNAFYVAYNPFPQNQVVTFSDGTVMNVPPFSFAVSNTPGSNNPPDSPPTPPQPPSSDPSCPCKPPPSSSPSPLPSPPVSSPPTSELPLSPDGSCGRKATLGPLYKCGTGFCCSQYGWCGQSESHCGEGCQPTFGTCR